MYPNYHNILEPIQALQDWGYTGPVRAVIVCYCALASATGVSEETTGGVEKVWPWKGWAGDGVQTVVLLCLGKQRLALLHPLGHLLAECRIAHPDLKLVETFDLAKPLSKELFVDSDGKSRIVESRLGSYREADPKKHRRFPVRFRVRNLSKTHRVIWTYPDDKPRTMN